MDISFKTAEGHFNLRVAGVFIRQNRLLLAKDRDEGYFFLPGGRVKLNETSEEAIRREMIEELDTEIIIHRLLWVVENIFSREETGEQYHEVGLYYLLSPAHEQELCDDDIFETREGEYVNNFEWLTLDRVKKASVYRTFIPKRIDHLPENVEHILIRE